LEAVATKLTQSPAQAQEHLNVALSMVRHSLAEARRSVMNLRSTALEGGGLPGALAETARQLVADKPIELTVQTTGESRSLGTDLEENLLRFGQEAITNAVKHAQASRIQIEIAYRDGKVLVSVRDNGRGFDPQSAELVNGAHFGLLGMRERAKQMDGQLRIQSAPGTGTEVTVEVPAH
jgi:signal transduction histidine kinase